MQNHASGSVQNSVLSHFGLRENPFGVTPDPRFLFFSHTHREALASLINGIEWGFGFQALVAQPGMGKTTLLLDLLRMFQGRAHTAFLFQPQLTPVELLQSLLSELGVNSQATSIRNLCDELNKFLVSAAEDQKRVIIILDEAQNLDFATLEMLRQLSNFETPRAKLMNVILAGQPQLLKKLSAPEQQQLQQRISAIARLSPFSPEDTSAYIEYRLKTAGASRTGLFPADVSREIWESSKGIPRNINRLCFNTMLLAFTEHARLVSTGSLQEAISDLDPDHIVLQMRPNDAPTKVTSFETKTFVSPELPVRITSISAAAASSNTHAAITSQVQVSPLPAKEPAKELYVEAISSGQTGVLSSQHAGNNNGASVLVAQKQVPAETVNAPANGNIRTGNNRPGLSIAAVRITNPPVSAAQPDHKPPPLLNKQNKQGGSQVWSKVVLLSVFAGLLLWFVMGKAATGSWPRSELKGSNSHSHPDSSPVASASIAKSRSVATLYFEEASARLDAQSRGSLEEVADLLAANPDIYLVLEGHTDDSGPEAYNLDLSGRRALAVRNVLCGELQVSTERVKVTALGSAEPEEPNASNAGRAHNRRVEIRVIERRP